MHYYVETGRSRPLIAQTLWITLNLLENLQKEGSEFWVFMRAVRSLEENLSACGQVSKLYTV